MMTNASDDEQRRDQTQFFADVRENKIGLDFGQVSVLLHSVAEAEARQTAGAKTNHGLMRLKRRAVQVRVRVQPCRNAAYAHGVVENVKRPKPLPPIKQAE